MVKVISQTEHVARKEYLCGLHEEAGNVNWEPGMLTFSELRTLAKYRQQKRRILKGEKYVRQFNEYEGHTYSIRMHKGMFEIFCKHNLFCEY